MRIIFDPVKSARNDADRGLPFDQAIEFDFENALLWLDDRRDYGEQRWVAIGDLGGRLHVICFVEIEDGIRVISLRKANGREVERWQNRNLQNP